MKYNVAKRVESRRALLRLEREMQEHPEDILPGGVVVELPVRHFFAPGVYCRELFIPKGCLLTGKIHKTQHVSIMLSGRMLVPDGMGGNKEICGPMTEIAQAGIKRVGLCLEDTTWVTVHPTEETDVDKILDTIIAKDFDEVDAYLGQTELLESP